MKKFSPRAQVVILLCAAGTIGLIATGGTMLSRVAAAHKEEGRQPREALGLFRPTDVQRAGLKIVPVEMASFRTEQVTDGSIAVNEETTTPVFSPFSGRVTRVLAKLGDEVKAGDALLAVEANEFVQGQNDLVAALAATNTARAQLALAERNERRVRDLYDAKAAALKDWQQSQADLTNARNGLRSAEIAHAAARSRLRILGKSDREIFMIENARAAAEMQREAIIRAPIAGTVVQRQVGVGQNITSAASGASTPVYAIGDLSTVWLVANVRETDVPFVRLGQRVEVRVLAYPARIFKARISWVSPVVDANTRRLPVRAEVENQDGALKAMMFASFSIVTADEAAAAAIPQGAVIYDEERARVWVAREDGALAKRPIKVSRTSNGLVEVTEGLGVGENVVASGALLVDRAAQSRE
ncbi:MAG: efflux RND transporter periplasmic adaptor subunit [Betaproteobacteria bacterium]|nr:efflux RND transporter periplasmic adaptor subunit [Betaproteobacteria bacterium]